MILPLHFKYVGTKGCSIYAGRACSIELMMWSVSDRLQADLGPPYVGHACRASAATSAGPALAFTLSLTVCPMASGFSFADPVIMLILLTISNAFVTPGNAAGTGPADKAAELSAERSGRASGPDTAEQGFVNGGKAAQQTQHAQRGSTEVAGGANGGESADHSPPQRAQHGSSGGGGNGAEQERQAGGNESSGDLPPHILDEQMQVPFVRKGTHGYHIIENMIEKKAERLAKEMDRMKK